MSQPLRVLFVEDSEHDMVVLVRELHRNGGYDPIYERVETAEAMKEALHHREWDIIISDYSLPDFSGIDALKLLKESGLDLPFIIVSGVISEETAVAAMKAGAHDYVLKRNLTRLAAAVERELAEARVRFRNKLLEGQFRHTQKMEALTRLAGGFAHDFNNLLMVIIGYAELRVNTFPKDDSLHKDFEQILNAAQEAANLTKHLLAFSHRQVVKPTVINPRLLIQDAETMFRLLLRKDIQCVLHLRPDTGKVKIDPEQFLQVLVKLLTNARDAMPQGGRIIIETDNFQLSPDRIPENSKTAAEPFAAPGNYVLIAVTDTGNGMSADVKEHLFEPFFSTKEKGEVVGLGLAVCYGIIKQAGGYLSVYSEIGKGSVFKIYLPQVEEGSEKESKQETLDSLPKGKETVLIVDDDIMVMELVSVLLQELGYTVLKAASGKEAIRLVDDYKDRQIHLLLMDVVMPQIHGKELALLLKQKHPEMRIIFTSGYTEEAIVQQGILDLNFPFIPKPMSRGALAKKVREVLDQLPS